MVVLVFVELAGLENLRGRFRDHIFQLPVGFHESFVLPRVSLVLSSLVRLVFALPCNFLRSFRTFVFLSKWRRLFGLLLQCCPGICKNPHPILNSIAKS